MERSGLQPQMLSFGGVPEAGPGSSGWSWCMRSRGQPRPTSVLQEVPSFTYKTYSMPDMTQSPSYVRGKKADQPFFGSEGPRRLQIADLKMTGGEKAREGF